MGLLSPTLREQQYFGNNNRTLKPSSTLHDRLHAAIELEPLRLLDKRALHFLVAEHAPQGQSSQPPRLPPYLPTDQRTT